MPQENEKTHSDVGSPTKDCRGPSTESTSEDLGKQKSDVKGQEDLELCKGADDMPELKNDHELENDEEISLDLCEPPPEVMEYARRELGETEEVKCQTLQEFRDMIYGKLEH